MDEGIRLAQETASLTSGKIMREAPENMTLAESTNSYAILDLLADKIEKRKKDLRAHLLTQAEAHGEDSENGHNKLMVEGTLIVRERRASKTPDADGIQRLLQAKGLPITEVFDERKILEMNVSKIEHLVSLGKLPEAEVNALKKVTYALKVTPAPALELALEEAAEKPKRKRAAAK